MAKKLIFIYCNLEVFILCFVSSLTRINMDIYKYKKFFFFIKWLVLQYTGVILTNVF